MTQRIILEILLFLVPFAVFLVYRAASRDLRIRDRWPLTRLTVIGAVIAVLGLIIPPLLEPRQTNECFDSVRYDGEGRVIPPKRVPCDEAIAPGANTPPPPPAQVPVPPRDVGG